VKGAPCIPLLALLTHCGDPLKPVYLVNEPRVLAARIEVIGDPGRAAPAPGERVSIRFLVGAPDPGPVLGWALFACVAAPPGASLPGCAEPPFSSVLSEPAAAEPVFEFDVPMQLEQDALLVYGVICPDGRAELAPPGCANGAGIRVSLDFPLAGEELNLNPSIAPEALRLDEQVWSTGTSCSELPQVEAGSEHTIELSLDETDRDPLKPQFDFDPEREALQVSHFTSAGQLERTFTMIDSSDEELLARVQWKAPVSMVDVTIVRFFIVVRDLRGGSDWVERAVCVSP
jgi:hypothetical protein